jgi:chaperonin GroES
MNIKPLADRILIQPISSEDFLNDGAGKTKSGIVLPDTVEKERPEQGKIIAVGPGRILENGQRQKMEIKKGDIVLFSKYGPTEFKINDKEYLIAKEEDILAIIK